LNNIRRETSRHFRNEKREYLKEKIDELATNSKNKNIRDLYRRINGLRGVTNLEVTCHHGMSRPQVADGGDGLQMWRVAANVLNKQSRTANKGWSSSLGVGSGANNSSP
jgi:hypothetical protein